ncbi:MULTISPECIES: hypothetical protein [Rhodococcus]|uniref:Lipoprotein n=1 Tax=Rhodococcus opacus TaxID=37919 RepID=A0A076F158_RHOOP|nr:MULTISPECIES: hypothetical protein [Rhodococcus]AII11348.1 hypothetical protein EP51_45900 [Rhodococcus opacus]
MTKKIVQFGIPLLISAGLLAGCSSNDSGTGSSASPTTSVVASSTMSPGGSVAEVAQVDPNTASQSQIQAAFEAAGVSNAGKWAKEVTEYGPYSPDTISDTLTKELGKYGIDQQTLDTILSVLAPQ